MDADRFWWVLEGGEAAEAAVSTFRYIKGDQNARTETFEKLLQAYNPRSSLVGAGRSRANKNICKGIVDYTVSKIATKKIRLRFLTHGSSAYLAEKQAKALEDLAGGLHYVTNFWAKVRDVYKDSCIFGLGVMKFCIEDDRVAVERVLPSEIFAPEEECRYGAPRQLFQIRTLSRSVLAAEFGKSDAVTLAGRIDEHETHETNVVSDLVDVIEAWHLPSGPDEEDGKHIIATSHGVLLEEEWEQEVFPFSFFYYTPAIVGIDGIGLVEELLNIQIELNLIQEKSRDELELGSSRVFVRKGEKLNLSQITNVPGSIIEYESSPPQFHSVQNKVLDDMYKRAEYLETSAYRDTGVSELGAAAKRIPGITSGVGLREMYDQTSERHMAQSQLFEDAVLDATRKMLVFAREVPALNVVVPKDGLLHKISASEKLLDPEQFEIEAFPSNLLPHLPAARLEQIKELMAAGLFDASEAMALLDYPDIRKISNIKLASRKAIEHAMDDIMDGKPRTCEAFFDMDLAMDIAMLRYQEAQSDGAPEDILELFRVFIESIQWQQQQLALAAQMQMQQQQQLAAPEVAPEQPLGE